MLGTRGSSSGISVSIESGGLPSFDSSGSFCTLSTSSSSWLPWESDLFSPTASSPESSLAPSGSNFSSDEDTSSLSDSGVACDVPVTSLTASLSELHSSSGALSESLEMFSGFSSSFPSETEAIFFPDSALEEPFISLIVCSPSGKP